MRSNSTKEFYQHWVTLQGNELYVFLRQKDKQHRYMHSLTSCFIKTGELDTQAQACPKSGKIYYPIAISIPPNKLDVLFFENTNDQKLWTDQLQKVMGYGNVFDFYKLEKTLGKGQFGLVKMATHLLTSQKVAIKQVKKKNMSHIEIFQQRREIEVLKMCQHPNIIKLLDLFENSDYYFIVLEYMQGADLFDYL